MLFQMKQRLSTNVKEWRCKIFEESTQPGHWNSTRTLEHSWKGWKSETNTIMASLTKKELENAITLLKSNKTIQKLYLKFLDELMKPNEEKSLTSSPATTAAAVVNSDFPVEDNIRFLMPLKDFNTERTTDEIIGKCDIWGPTHSISFSVDARVNAPKRYNDL